MTELALFGTDLFGALIEIRNAAWKRRSLPVPLRAEDRVENAA